MIRDTEDLIADTELRAEVCVVGGGPAGITLALALAKTGQRILLLESGGDVSSDTAQALNVGEVADEGLHSPPDKYRQRCLGGATAIWGGRCMPFDPIDFETRPWITTNGWPISHGDIEQYYPAANAMCEAGEYEYDARLAVPDGMRPMVRGFAPEYFDLNRIERFSCPTNFGARYRHRLAAERRIQVVLNATVVDLIASADGSRIERLTISDRHDRRFVVSADQFVLAAGGMEVPRILLLSDAVHRGGIGNTNDLVGRYYMSHIAGTIGRLTIAAARDAVWHGYDIAEDGTYCRRRMWLRPEVQRQLALSNAVYRLHHPRITDPSHRTGPLSSIFMAQRFISYEYAKRLVSDSPPGVATWLRHAMNVVVDSPSTAIFLARWLRYRTLAERKFPSVIIRPRTNLFSLDFHAEQVPNRESRVMLGSGRDRFGNRQVRVDWRYSAQDVDTVTRSFGLLREDFVRGGVGTLVLDRNEPDIETVIRRDGAYGGHHIGTARMGVSAGSGVVDRNAKVFGVNNLHIAGSAVFPTSGQANPTLTIVAMALRLADHLAGIAARVPRVTTIEQPLPVE
jgi:choline dehydrogenase-like flavoprotein